MSKSTYAVTALFVLSNFGIANAVSSYTYNLTQDSVYLLAALACLIWALRIFLSLRGGSLQTPWIFFSAGFATAAVGGIIQLLDLLQIAIHQYDLRPAMLATTCGSLILLLLGLIIYKRNLE